MKSSTDTPPRTPCPLGLPQGECLYHPQWGERPWPLHLLEASPFTLNGG